ncbi:hypothetical protein ACED30_22295 [Vibrio splendidus]|uniref:hypothetical protein n=1 Tax=Vibrio splendidus TaxID=29497 RepID=UPI000A978F5D|nr:hypothetical protein [Vibrio splendidus]
MNQFTELVGMRSYFQKHLDDPVNWVAFIKEHNMSVEEQKYWRDHFNLEHLFEGELEA